MDTTGPMVMWTGVHTPAQETGPGQGAAWDDLGAGGRGEPEEGPDGQAD